MPGKFPDPGTEVTGIVMEMIRNLLQGSCFVVAVGILHDLHDLLLPYIVRNQILSCIFIVLHQVGKKNLKG